MMHAEDDISLFIINTILSLPDEGKILLCPLGVLHKFFPVFLSIPLLNIGDTRRTTNKKGRTERKEKEGAEDTTSRHKLASTPK